MPSTRLPTRGRCLPRSCRSAPPPCCLLKFSTRHCGTTSAWRGVAWRGVAWRGVAWRGVAWPKNTLTLTHTRVHSRATIREPPFASHHSRATRRCRSEQRTRRGGGTRPLPCAGSISSAPAAAVRVQRGPLWQRWWPLGQPLLGGDDELSTYSWVEEALSSRQALCRWCVVKATVTGFSSGCLMAC
jgi:hypothetical protein